MRKRFKMLAAGAVLALCLTGCAGGEKAGVTTDQAKVTLGEYKGLEIQINNPEVTDAEVEQAVQAMIDAWNNEAPSDKETVEEGDTVMCTVHGTLADGTEIEDGADASGFITPGTNQTYPEVEQALIGMKTGEEKAVNITLPDPYEQNPELSGAEVTMHVMIQYIRSTETLSLDTLTDEQAAMAFSGDGISSVQGLYDKMRALIGEGREERIRNSAYQKICEVLLDTCTVDPFPTAELEKRMDDRMEQMTHICEAYYGTDLEGYLEQLGMTEKEYRKENEESVRDTIKLELIFTEIADRENIRYPEDEFEAYLEKVMAENSYESREKLFEEYSEDYIKMAFRIEYVVDWLIDNADLTWTEPAVEEEGVLDGGADIEVPAETDDDGLSGEKKGSSPKQKNITDRVTEMPLKKSGGGSNEAGKNGN